MIGVDRRFAGHGHGGDLLVDGLTRIALAADQLGLAVVILDVLDDRDEVAVTRRVSLCARHGFQSLPSNPLRMFLPITTVRRLLDQPDQR